MGRSSQMDAGSVLATCERGFSKVTRNRLLDQISPLERFPFEKVRLWNEDSPVVARSAARSARHAIQDWLIRGMHRA